jgi:hypothetical protein
MDYFTDLTESHSWSSVKLDLYGLKFYHEHVLKKAWESFPKWYESERGYVFPRRNESERG